MEGGKRGIQERDPTNGKRSCQLLNVQMEGRAAAFSSSSHNRATILPPITAASLPTSQHVYTIWSHSLYRRSGGMSLHVSTHTRLSLQMLQRSRRKPWGP